MTPAGTSDGLACSQNKHSFRGPGGGVKGKDSVGAPRSVRENWPLWSPVISRGVPWHPVASRGMLCDARSSNEKPIILKDRITFHIYIYNFMNV